VSENVIVATPLATPVTVNVALPSEFACAEDVTVATAVLLLVAVIVRFETVDTVMVVESAAAITKVFGDGAGEGKVSFTVT
jgi:hypothetical protein